MREVGDLNVITPEMDAIIESYMWGAMQCLALLRASDAPTPPSFRQVKPDPYLIDIPSVHGVPKMLGILG